jgi:predicted secreted protein
MSLIISFICIWWLCFFLILPIGIKEKEVKTKNLYKKEIEKIYFLRKFIIATIFAIPLSLLFDNIFLEYLLRNIN